ncbi:hypothetical protein F2Q70_00013461 [Brassica cretica]|uniref:KIB1-4 beta-propeller domain-containing protein n=1 Tax=Brassica cretica TaxID=69181 RepID=A0A8S9LYZ0_BRACR|nr:hypothetical protein F2Q70_00013461 [Brassica cretica]
MDVRTELRGLDDMVLKGYNLYFFSTRRYIRHLDLSGQDDVKDVSVYHKFPMSIPMADERAMPRIFRLYNRDAKDLEPNTLDTFLVEVDSLGDEALFVNLGITVPADRTLGIEPNSIYFTRDDRRFSHTKRSTPRGSASSIDAEGKAMFMAVQNTWSMGRDVNRRLGPRDRPV